MAFSYIWNKLHLHWQKIAKPAFIVLLLLGCQGTALAQVKIKQDNKSNYDAKRVHYGFYLSLPLTSYKVEHSQEYANQLSKGASAMTINPKITPGFYTGLVLNVGLADYLDFRFVPGVGFYSRTIEYANIPQPDGTASKTENVTLGATVIELPLLLQYKSKRRTNYRMYFVGGIKPGIDLNSRKNDQPGEELRTQDFDLALEYGVGLDMFYPFFKFAPELRFSHGLINQHIADDNIYSRNLQRMTTNNVSFILFFE
ncbi:type IX secretion/gliding motility protein PorT/SprT [Botryobacter ruber]|uniref:type IX secretion/gliding motility protein PorT/SprT n=1 Tax=Botryobacter ruber TaxID=2171629 RepID=UPI000E0BC4B3|nr:porin family protein [Botryobacter ruber]